VHVQVDEAGQQVPAGGVDLVVPSRGWRFASSGSPGVPALRIAAMRLPSMTTSIGPAGGAPVPSMTVTPRITIRVKGPAPSPGPRSGAGMMPCWAWGTVTATVATSVKIARRFFMLPSWVSLGR
jgi:hypothetical protein